MKLMKPLRLRCTVLTNAAAAAADNLNWSFGVKNFAHPSVATVSVHYSLPQHVAALSLSEHMRAALVGMN